MAVTARYEIQEPQPPPGTRAQKLSESLRTESADHVHLMGDDLPGGATSVNDTSGIGGALERCRRGLGDGAVVARERAGVVGGLGPRFDSATLARVRGRAVEPEPEGEACERESEAACSDELTRRISET